MKILVAEDDHIAGHILVKILESFGFEPVWCKDGREAHDWFCENPCQIVVSDCMMPGMDGIELCKKIRAMKRAEYTYFVLLTAKIAPIDGPRVLSIGVDAFIPKPVQKEQLAAKLNVALNIIQNAQGRQIA